MLVKPCFIAGACAAFAPVLARPGPVSAESCPQPDVYATAAGTGTYLLRFSDYEDAVGVAGLTFFAARASYRVSLPIAVNAEPPFGFVSTVYSLRKAGDDPLVGVSRAGSKPSTTPSLGFGRNGRSRALRALQ